MNEPIYCTGACDACKDYARELGVPLVVMPPYGHQPVQTAGITGGYSWACPECGTEVTSWYLPPRLETADKRCVSEADLAAALWTLMKAGYGIKGTDGLTDIPPNLASHLVFAALGAAT